MTLFKRIEKIYGEGYRQKTECDCGPASVILVARAMGLKRVTHTSLLTENYGRWLNRQAGRVRGMILTELHFATEATLGTKYEVALTRAFPENYKKFLDDLKLAKASKLTMILNFNQDYIMGRPYKNDETAFTHYSPIMGFENNWVTIADVDQELEVAYSVTVKRAFYSMSEPHHIFGYPRGWMTIRKR